MVSFKKLSAFILIIAIVFGQTEFSRRQTANVFRNLRKSQIGRDIFASIKLELTTANSSEGAANIVDQVLGILYEIRESLLAENAEAQQNAADREEECDARVNSIQVDIDNLNERIAKGQAKVPQIAEATSIKLAEKEQKSEEHQRQTEKIAELLRKNDAAIAAHAEADQQHDDMIEALREAKRIISQLQVTGFIQKKFDHKQLLKDHYTSVKDTLRDHQSMGVLKMLLHLASKDDIQADQDQVNQVLTIIDELIQAEQDVQQAEAEVEQKRQVRFQFDHSRASAALASLEADLKDLEADAHTSALRQTELENDIQNWKNSVRAKTEQLQLQKQTCQDSVEAIHTNFNNNNDILEIIEQVIAIFESKDIQEIKAIISDDIEY